ncbi:MAG: hypothetical protein ABR586_04465 [Thermoplasmatota archaeon]
MPTAAKPARAPRPVPKKARSAPWPLVLIWAEAAFDALACGLASLRATESAALLPRLDGLPLALAMLAAAFWFAALGWALVLGAPWARFGQAATLLALAAGAAAWLRPGWPPLAILALEAVAFALAALMLTPTAKKWPRPAVNVATGVAVRSGRAP